MPNGLEQKAIDLKIGDQGVVEAVFSVFDVVDRDLDIITRESLLPYDGAEVPMVASHDWSLGGWIGKGRIIVGEKDARFVGSFLMDDPDGQAAFRKVKAFQGLSQWSWAFRVSDAVWEQRDGTMIRVVKSLEERPYEVSPVLVGANQYTSTVGIKGGIETRAEWDTAYINDLPDSSFAVILPGGEKDEDGKTTPRQLRKLPHHSAEGTLDLPHLRDALSREPQADLTEEQHAKAKAHLQRHAEAEGIGTDDTGKAIAAVMVALDHLEEKAGRTMSQANLDRMHEVMKAMDSMHGSLCDMGDDCPMQMKSAHPEDDHPDFLSPQRKAELRELQATLGYRPLIAGAAKLD